MTVTLDVLPAAHGDALVITYGAAGGEHDPVDHPV